MRIEPKTFFANERTFLTWLHMAVTVGTIAAALLGFSGTAGRTEKHPKRSAVSVAASLQIAGLPSTSRGRCGPCEKEEAAPWPSAGQVLSIGKAGGHRLGYPT